MLADLILQASAAFKLADDYEKASGDFSKQVGAYNRMVASSQDPSPAGDLSLIFNYMKVLDPGVRLGKGNLQPLLTLELLVTR